MVVDLDFLFLFYLSNYQIINEIIYFSFLFASLSVIGNASSDLHYYFTLCFWIHISNNFIVSIGINA